MSARAYAVHSVCADLSSSAPSCSIKVFPFIISGQIYSLELPTDNWRFGAWAGYIKRFLAQGSSHSPHRRIVVIVWWFTRPWIPPTAYVCGRIKVNLKQSNTHPSLDVVTLPDLFLTNARTNLTLKISILFHPTPNKIYSTLFNFTALSNQLQLNGRNAVLGVVKLAWFCEGLGPSHVLQISSSNKPKLSFNETDQPHPNLNLHSII